MYIHMYIHTNSIIMLHYTIVECIILWHMFYIDYASTFKQASWHEELTVFGYPFQLTHFSSLDNNFTDPRSLMETAPDFASIAKVTSRIVHKPCPTPDSRKRGENSGESPRADSHFEGVNLPPDEGKPSIFSTRGFLLRETCEGSSPHFDPTVGLAFVSVRG